MSTTDLCESNFSLRLLVAQCLCLFLCPSVNSHSRIVIFFSRTNVAINRWDFNGTNLRRNCGRENVREKRPKFACNGLQLTRHFTQKQKETFSCLSLSSVLLLLRAYLNQPLWGNIIIIFLRWHWYIRRRICQRRKESISGYLEIAWKEMFIRSLVLKKKRFKVQ